MERKLRKRKIETEPVPKNIRLILQKDDGTLSFLEEGDFKRWEEIMNSLTFTAQVVQQQDIGLGEVSWNKASTPEEIEQLLTKLRQNS